MHSPVQVRHCKTYPDGGIGLLCNVVDVSWNDLAAGLGAPRTARSQIFDNQVYERPRAHSFRVAEGYQLDGELHQAGWSTSRS